MIPTITIILLPVECTVSLLSLSFEDAKPITNVTEIFQLPIFFKFTFHIIYPKFAFRVFLHYSVDIFSFTSTSFMMLEGRGSLRQGCAH